MYRYKQEPPFCVQIEMTEGCNLRCPFCAINSIRPKEQFYKHLTVEAAEDIAEKIASVGWNSRIEFAMHGEPTMNPKFLEIIHVFRRRLEKNVLIMESNGVGWVRHTADKIIEAFNVGINNLAIEDYKTVDFLERIRPRIYGMQELLKGMGVKVYEYPGDREGNPHQRGKFKKLTFIADISEASSGTHSSIHNSAGLAGKPNDRRANERCAKPFREISVRWDGSVAICCNDWRGNYKVGNVLEAKSLDDIWQSDQFIAARLKLYAGQRDFGPCNGCDASSYRLGLLPDKFGKESLPKPDKEAKIIIKKALAGKTLTPPILRPWEKEK